MVKKVILFSTLLAMIIDCGIAYSQIENNTTHSYSTQICNKCDSLYNRICPPTSKIFSGHPDVLPCFPGGEREMMKFIATNITYPQECAIDSIQGRVILRFIITEEGKMICIKIHRSLHPAMDEEALRVVKLMPDWRPASTNGVPLRMCYTLPVLFKLNDDKPNFFQRLFRKLF
jgi:TonB family protein